MAQASSHPRATIVAAIIGALALISAAYIGLQKPTERQIVTSEQYKDLVHESAAYRSQVENLTRQIKSLSDEQATARTLHEMGRDREISQLKDDLKEKDAQVSSLQAERDTLARELALAKTAAGGAVNYPSKLPAAHHVREAGTPELEIMPLDLKKLVGRWVGVAECSRGDYPTSIEVTKATNAELNANYSDSLNGNSQDATLILLPSSSGRVSFSFRTNDDRFIVMKNGNKLLLERSGLLVSPADAGKQCKIALIRS